MLTWKVCLASVKRSSDRLDGSCNASRSAAAWVSMLTRRSLTPEYSAKSALEAERWMVALATPAPTTQAAMTSNSRMRRRVDMGPTSASAPAGEPLSS